MDWKTYLQYTFLDDYFVNRADELESIYAGEVNKEVSEAMFEALYVFHYDEKHWSPDERYEQIGKKKGISQETWELVKHALEDVPKEKIEDLYYFFVDIWMITRITEKIMEHQQCNWEKAIAITNNFTVISLLADGEDMREHVHYYHPSYWAEEALKFQKQLQQLEEGN